MFLGKTPGSVRFALAAITEGIQVTRISDVCLDGTRLQLAIQRTYLAHDPFFMEACFVCSPPPGLLAPFHPQRAHREFVPVDITPSHAKLTFL